MDKNNLCEDNNKISPVAYLLAFIFKLNSRIISSQIIGEFYLKIFILRKRDINFGRKFFTEIFATKPKSAPIINLI